jgi:hypothetical protein
MLRILGSTKTLCDGVTRRDMLRIGGLGLLGSGLAPFPKTDASAAAEPDRGAHFGKAKRVILLYLYGAAAQHELWDLKPEAPDEIRSTFQPIDTVVPGIQVCEHLPNIAGVADKCCFIRSMTHPYNIHSAAYTLTGIDKVDIPMELNPYDIRNWPFFGSVLEYIHQQQNPDSPAPPVPRNIGLPFQFSARATAFKRAGPYAGFLGRGFNPVWTDFEGKPTRSIKRWLGNRETAVEDPYAGIEPDCRFTFSDAAQLQPEITLDRFDQRRSLLEQLDDSRRRLDDTAGVRSLDRAQELACSLLASPRIREALDVQREPRELRERYGMTLFGQATLTGRRLLEAGAKVVSVFWDEYTTVNSGWDTHFNHFERLSGELLPGLDRALSALLLDLETRGMLDDTLVMCLTEHGRTPKLSKTPRGAGREHWSEVYSNLLAGAGIAHGTVVGSSDKHGAYVKDDPVSPKDVLCTMYHLLGFDPHATIPDRLNRPFRLVSEGEIHPRLLG